MNFCERLREIRNELKTIEVIQEHSLYNLKAYTTSIQSELSRLEINLRKFDGKKAQYLKPCEHPLLKETTHGGVLSEEKIERKCLVCGEIIP